MTEIWAGICRLIRIQAYDVQIWLLERKKWLLDCGIGALDAQIQRRVPGDDAAGH